MKWRTEQWNWFPGSEPVEVFYMPGDDRYIVMNSALGSWEIRKDFSEQAVKDDLVIRKNFDSLEAAQVYYLLTQGQQ